MGLSGTLRDFHFIGKLICKCFHEYLSKGESMGIALDSDSHIAPAGLHSQLGNEIIEGRGEIQHC